LKKSNLINYLLILCFIIEATGFIKVKSFTKDEIKWFVPYNKNDSVIFVSSKKELDTMIFYKKVAQSDTVRSFERGYYNENYLIVPYKLTKGSYHQFALMSDGKTRYDQDIFNISKNSDGRISFEITFLGTIFNGKELNKIQQLNNMCIISIVIKLHMLEWMRNKIKQLKILHLTVELGLLNILIKEAVNGQER